MVLMPLLSRLLTLLVILTMPLFLARLTLIPIKSLDRKSGSAGMPRPISYAVFCLKKKTAYFREGSCTIAMERWLFGYSIFSWTSHHVETNSRKHVAPELCV